MAKLTKYGMRTALAESGITPSIGASAGQPPYVALSVTTDEEDGEGMPKRIRLEMSLEEFDRVAAFIAGSRAQYEGEA